MQDFLEIGQIVNTFGIKGMVKIKPFTDDIRRFDDLKKVYIENNKSRKDYEIEEVKYHKEMVLIKFKGVETVEQAELLRNYYLKVKREQLIIYSNCSPTSEVHVALTLLFPAIPHFCLYHFYNIIGYYVCHIKL